MNLGTLTLAALADMELQFTTIRPLAIPLLQDYPMMAHDPSCSDAESLFGISAKSIDGDLHIRKVFYLLANMVLHPEVFLCRKILLPTGRDLFNYCDPDESGNISMEEFQDRCAVTSGLETVPAVYHVVLAAWISAAGDERSHLTFAQFARWDAKIKLPVGVDPADAKADRPCRFEYGKRCPCANFKAHRTNCTDQVEATRSWAFFNQAFRTGEKARLLNGYQQGIVAARCMGVTSATLLVSSSIVLVYQRASSSCGLKEIGMRPCGMSMLPPG
ncbi:Hypothetical protein (Fragment), partial [Durusdinium trenchii]